MRTFFFHYAGRTYVMHATTYAHAAEKFGELVHITS